MALEQGRGSAIVGILVLVAIAAGSLQGTQAVQHVVGGSAGWSLPSLVNVNYSVWESQQTFRVGDTLLFNYSKAYHNVEQVSKADYNSCNFSNAIATYDDGSTVISLNKTGTFYFICGIPGHCAAGQKVEVKVSKAAAAPVSAPGPSPAISPSSPSPAVSPVGSAPSPAGSAPAGSPTSVAPSSVGTSSGLASPPPASPPASNAHPFKCTLALGWGLAVSCLMIL